MQEQSETPRARILIVDDHAFMRVGIKASLREDVSLEVVGEAKDGQEAIARCREIEPDLVLMDVRMPKMNGLEATRKIKAGFPKTSVLIPTAHADHRLIMDAVKAGAAGYLLKGDDTEHVLDTVRAVLSGETPLKQKEAMQVLRGLAHEDSLRERAPTASPSESHKSKLSSQEKEVLRLIALGNTNRQIAQELLVSLSSVKTYVQRIIKKLEVSDRTQASVRAVEMGLLPEKG